MLEATDLTWHRILFSADTQGSNQGTDTDPGCSQVIDLIDLQTGIDLARIGQRISLTSSVVTASRPQPNEFSWMRSRSSRSFT